MSLKVVADGTLGWSIEANSSPDAYIRKTGAGDFRLTPNASGGCWIYQDGVAYSLDPAGQDFMAVSSEVITASTSAVALNTAATTGVTLLIKNTSGNAADLGGSDVVAAAGFALAAAAVVTVVLKPGDVLYAIRTGGSDATIAVLRT